MPDGTIVTVRNPTEDHRIIFGVLNPDKGGHEMLYLTTVRNLAVKNRVEYDDETLHERGIEMPYAWVVRIKKP